MKNVCVFCGSRYGQNPNFKKVAEELGSLLAKSNLGLVYGGGKVGLMGTVADATLHAGGKVYGVLPEGLFDREVGHTGLTKLHMTKDMHSRKAKMAELSDAFVAMPGGFGTLDELCEIITWSQLGIHKKPILMLNTDNFWMDFFGLVENCSREGFIAEKELFQAVNTPAEAVKKILASIN